MLFEPSSSQRTFLQNPSLWNRCACFFFNCKVSASEIEEAVNRIIETNDALRMHPEGDSPHVVDFIFTPIPVVEFGSEDEMQCFLKAEMDKNLFEGRFLFRLFIVHLDARLGVACIIHHSIVDGFSFDVFSRKLVEYLHGNSLYENSFLPHLKDEATYRSSSRFQQDAAFWNAQLAPIPSLRCFDASDSDESLTENVELPVNQLRDFCKERDLSEADVLYSVLAVLLYRLRGVDIFTIGCPVIGRTRKTDYETMGLFMHIVPLVAEVSNKPFAEIAFSIKEKLLSLYRHYGFSAYDIQKNCLKGDLAYKNLFDVTAEYTVSEHNEEITPFEVFSDHLPVALEVHFHRQGEKLIITMRRRKDIPSLITTFELLLRQCMKSPAQPITDYKLTTHICARGADAEIPNVGLYALVEHQDKGRILDGEKEYFIDDLRHDAEKIDAAVRGEKRIIGVLCERSYTELAAIYGIVRGGNAYLPISPEYPAERIHLMLEQSKCDTILVQRKFQGIVPDALIIENILEGETCTSFLPVAALPGDPLYVIFTSGSTGIPKGAVVSNRSAVNRILWMCRKYFAPETVVMLKTPFTFDVSVWEIFGFAVGGFTLYILPPEDHYRQDRVIEHIRKGNVTDLHFVPSVFRFFLDTLKKDGEPLPSLKNIFLSGEALSASLANEAPANVHNLYGPTECAVDVTYYDCAKREHDPIPIGMPLDNCQVYVLNEHLLPVPTGVVGQICIGGAPVGQGYINDAAQTNQVFISNPLGQGDLYMTGDLGLWREDGQLVFVGRHDQQIKINGQRVELGEIEAALGEFVPVAAVKVDAGRLIAFYAGPERADLREALIHKLPRHMIPHSFVHVSEIPLTDSGKIDRIALKSFNNQSNSYTPPIGEVESTICALFSRILNARLVGRDDNFYDLGGTSLNMMELLSEKVLESLSPADFMANPTPAGLATHLARKENQSALVSLYYSDDARYSLILFPYGGGDAAAYTALVTEFRKRHAPVALYYVPWGCNYDAVAQNLRSLHIPIIFYSHCAGAVIAMKLLDRLDCVDQFIAGANIPPQDLTNFWPSVSDEKLISVLHQAGMPTLSHEKEMIHRFRINTDEYFAFFKEKHTRTSVRTTLVLSKTDLFTSNYLNAEGLWGRYVTCIEGIHYIDSPSHYFQSTNADALANILLGDRC